MPQCQDPNFSKSTKKLWISDFRIEIKGYTPKFSFLIPPQIQETDLKVTCTTPTAFSLHMLPLDAIETSLRRNFDALKFINKKFKNSIMALDKITLSIQQHLFYHCTLYVMNIQPNSATTVSYLQLCVKVQIYASNFQQTQTKCELSMNF